MHSLQCWVWIYHYTWILISKRSYPMTFSQIFSVKPSFWKYFLRVKLAESTTFSTSDARSITFHMIWNYQMKYSSSFIQCQPCLYDSYFITNINITIIQESYRLINSINLILYSLIKLYFQLLFSDPLQSISCFESSLSKYCWFCKKYLLEKECL